MKAIFIGYDGIKQFEKEISKETLDNEAIWEGDKFWMSEKSKESGHGYYILED